MVIIITVTAGNNYAKEKQFQKLVSKAAEDWIPTVRGGNGHTKTISNDDLMVGDVIKLEQGMRVPADCILLDGTDIAADESGLTGEPEQLEKTPLTDNNFEHNPVPFLLAKTLIVSG